MHHINYGFYTLYSIYEKKTFMINEFDFKSLGKEYKKNSPFPYIVIDNFLDQKLCKEIEFFISKSQ